MILDRSGYVGWDAGFNVIVDSANHGWVPLRLEYRTHKSFERAI
jgi:hypothetical protein